MIYMLPAPSPAHGLCESAAEDGGRSHGYALQLL